MPVDRARGERQLDIAREHVLDVDLEAREQLRADRTELLERTLARRWFVAGLHGQRARDEDGPSVAAGSTDE